MSFDGCSLGAQPPLAAREKLVGQFLNCRIRYEGA